MPGVKNQAPTIIIKAELFHYMPWRCLVQRYSSYSFSTSALDGGEQSASCPGRALPPGKGPPAPVVQEAGWAPELVWTQMIEGKSCASAGDRTLIARLSSPQSDTIPTELPRLLIIIVLKNLKI
jgi:hypothetical protein